jgi:hypothetical protein
VPHREARGRDAGDHMKRTVLLLAVAGPLLLNWSCGGSSSPSTPNPQPTATPVPAAEAPQVINGWNEQPLVAEVSPPIVGLGDGVVVRAPGYLPREQLYALEPIALWPANPSYVRELVYDWDFPDGSFRMVRWSQPFTLTLDGALADDGAVRARARQVLDEIGRRTGLQIPIGPGGEVRVTVDPSVADEEAVALARLSFRGATISSGSISFVNRQEIVGGRGAGYSNTFLHEMGHIVGLGHSPDPSDVMTPAEGRGTTFDVYQRNESIALHMMYFHRAAGNRHPDRDSQLAAASGASPWHTVIID